MASTIIINIFEDIDDKGAPGRENITVSLTYRDGRSAHELRDEITKALVELGLNPTD